MLEILVAVLIVLAVVVLVFLFRLGNGLAETGKELVRQSAAVNALQGQIEAIRSSQDKHTEAVTKNLAASQQNIGQFLQTNQQTLSKLGNQLGGLEKSSQQMMMLGADVRSLQDILKSPKMRGQLGEWSLENLLADILPVNSFKLQYGFKNGRVVDAIIITGDYLVPVDAKFPLPSFEAMVNAENDAEKTRLRRQFQKDIVNHIDKIAANYINPGEGTLDFALMYIPAENVYYETVIKYAEDKTDILKYALDKKVIPVSPNLVYVYLMTVVMGLHGLQIETQAAEIRKNLKQLIGGIQDFASAWSVLGRHLRNAQGQYDEGQKKLDKFSMQLEQIQIEGQQTE